MKKAIPYYRVSTLRQGESGLGLEAQQKAVRDYAARFNINLLQECIEIESGKKSNRPVLLDALDKCKKQNAVLLIAKLDRLSRNVAFIAQLMEAGVDFLAVDNPHASKLMLHIMAAFAEHEREQISKRTKAALASAKYRGVQLGKNGRDILSKKNKALANRFALKMKPVIEGLKTEGYISIRALTTVLNKRNIQPYTGSKARWHTHTVYALLKRIESL
jgi:DNA invertase Pin-like site-specific DNA recombinase